MSVLAPLALLALWELLVRTGLLNPQFFPGPTTIYSEFARLSGNGQLLDTALVSLQRLGIGFVIGAVPGVLIGIVMGLSRWARTIAEPIIAALYPIPKTAIFPLLLIIFGLGEASKIAVVAIGVFFPVVVNTAAGVLGIPMIHHDVAKNFRASRFDVFRTVALPGAAPLIIAGMKLGVGMALMLIVVAEMLGGTNGLGFMIWNSWSTFRVETMYVALILISVLGVALTFLLTEVERFLTPWNRAKR
ncbi:ABC transporter permease [Sinomonas sp. P10A9]|uniref:ABC transporter permease n=1 Tax=Sinomonas puerhi TaxID=3238584 RepID=A0AB39L6X6_9MICC